MRGFCPRRAEAIAFISKGRSFDSVRLLIRQSNGTPYAFDLYESAIGLVNCVGSLPSALISLWQCHMLYLSGIRVVDESPNTLSGCQLRFPVYPLPMETRAVGVPITDPVCAIHPRTWGINLWCG